MFIYLSFCIGKPVPNVSILLLLLLTCLAPTLTFHVVLPAPSLSKCLRRYTHHICSFSKSALDGKKLYLKTI